jgi:hypothetical protein
MPYFIKPAFDLLWSVSPALVAIVPVVLIFSVFAFAYYFDDDVMSERERQRARKEQAKR